MARPETERELRTWLAAQLRRPMVPEGIWKELRDSAFVRTALESLGQEGLVELLEAARSYLRAAARPVRPTPLGRKQRSASKTLLAAAEIRRAEVFSISLANLGASDSTVLKFRKDVLGSRILSGPEAHSLLGSPAPYLLTATELRSWGIPGREHRAEARNQRTGLGGARWSERVVLKLTIAGRRKTYKFAIRRSFGDAQWLEIPQHLWGRVSPFREVEPFVRPSSAFDQLRKASNWLSQRFPWHPWDATWFVLTGTPPFIPPAEPGIRRRNSQMESGGVYRRDLITLVVDPWLSAASLIRVYRAYQRALLTGRNRGLRAACLDLFQFVTEREGIEGRSLKWEELRTQWNRVHRERKYGDYRNFRRDFERARRAILLPERRTVGPIPLW
jgi:hypothetical protein